MKIFLIHLLHPKYNLYVVDNAKNLVKRCNIMSIHGILFKSGLFVEGFRFDFTVAGKQNKKQ